MYIIIQNRFRGEAMEENKTNLSTTTKDSKSLKNIAFGILGFLIPPVGYVLYLVFQKKNAKLSKTIGWFTLIGCAVYLVLIIVLILILKPGIK